MYLPLFAAAMCLCDLVQRILFFAGPNTVVQLMVWQNKLIQIFFRILGTQVRVTKSAELPQSGPLLIVSNHQSIYDVTILSAAFGKYLPRFVSKKELANWVPGTSYCLRNGEHALIDRRDKQQAQQEIAKFAERTISRKSAAVLFPEGTRARDGNIKQFRTTGFEAFVSNAPNVPIVPVAIDGTWRLSKNKIGPMPWGTTIEVRILQPIYFSSTSGTEQRDLLTAIHDDISAELDKIRQPKS